MLEQPLMWIAGAIGVAGVAWRSQAANKGVTPQMEEAARRTAYRLHGILEREHGRIAIEGRCEGRKVHVSFPPVAGRGAHKQKMRIRVYTPGVPDMIVSRHDVSGDLMSRGVMHADATVDRNMAQRIRLLFHDLEASDLVFRDHWAEVTVSWPYVDEWLDSTRMVLPIRATRRLVGAVLREPTQRSLAA